LTIKCANIPLAGEKNKIIFVAKKMKKGLNDIDQYILGSENPVGYEKQRVPDMPLENKDQIELNKQKSQNVSQGKQFENIPISWTHESRFANEMLQNNAVGANGEAPTPRKPVQGQAPMSGSFNPGLKMRRVSSRKEASRLSAMISNQMKYS
jgi:hypothetical protein